jgi:hypothetical protein
VLAVWLTGPAQGEDGAVPPNRRALLPPVPANAGASASRPTLLLPHPASTATGPAVADTEALMPAGNYWLVQAAPPGSPGAAVRLTRQGAGVTVKLASGDLLVGQLDASGRLHLSGPAGLARIELDGTVRAGSASGSLGWTRGTQQLSGRFELTPTDGTTKR